ncbi:MAG: hypothetical protein HRT38_15835 [Alteromonadaceae bacterium]|nr:hypothetical protein [Alteromonadaceae bacterium]
MLILIDVERNVDVNKNVKVQSNSTDDLNSIRQFNVINFKSKEILELESRQKAIEVIRKRTKQLHW